MMACNTLSMCFIAPFVFFSTISGTTSILQQFLVMLLLMFLANNIMKTMSAMKTTENMEVTTPKLTTVSW